VWVQNILFLIVAGLIFSSASAIDIARIRLVVAAIGLIFFMGVILHEVRELRLSDLIRVAWRPVVAAAAMAFLDIVITPPDTLPLMLAFLLEVLIGALSYTTILLGLWYASGRPQGAEAYILSKLKLGRLLHSVQRNDAP
jgi:hypothetical protein